MDIDVQLLNEALTGVDSDDSHSGDNEDSPKSGCVNEYELALVGARKASAALDALEQKLKLALITCRSRIAEVRTRRMQAKRPANELQFISCVRPYFKTADNFPSPFNADGRQLAIAGIPSVSNLPKPLGWQPNHKRALLASVERQLSLNSSIDWNKVAARVRIHSSLECAAYWTLFLNPEVNKKPWKPAERNHLSQLIKQYQNQDWDSIAKSLGTGRTGYQCFVHNCVFLAQKTKYQKWTKEEDAYLLQVVENCKMGHFIPWTKVSYFIPERTKHQIYNRYSYLNEAKNRLPVKRFSAKEDEIILTALDLYGTRYALIANWLPNRTRNDVRVRHRTYKAMNRKYSWTYSEDLRLIKMMSKNTPNQSRQLFPDRTKLSLIVRYHTLRIQRLHKKYGSDQSTLKKILENRLKLALEAASEETKSKSKCKPILTHIDHLIVMYFRNIATEKVLQSVEIKNDSIDPNTLRSFLTLLGASLDRNKISSVEFQSQPGFLKEAASALNRAPDTAIRPAGIRTYSRKKLPAQHTDVPVSSQIWNDNPDKIYYHLPPSFATLTGFRNLMAFPKTWTSNSNTSNGDSHTERCKERIETIFKWPLMLSQFPVNVKINIFEEHSKITALSAQQEEEPSPKRRAKEVTGPYIRISNRKKIYKPTENITADFSFENIDHDKLSYVHVKQKLRDKSTD